MEHCDSFECISTDFVPDFATILSWHVYSQKNRDKVRQDEAQAEDEQAKIDERAVAAVNGLFIVVLVPGAAI